MKNIKKWLVLGLAVPVMAGVGLLAVGCGGNGSTGGNGGNGGYENGPISTARTFRFVSSTDATNFQDTIDDEIAQQTDANLDYFAKVAMLHQQNWLNNSAPYNTLEAIQAPPSHLAGHHPARAIHNDIVNGGFAPGSVGFAAELAAATSMDQVWDLVQKVHRADRVYFLNHSITYMHPQLKRRIEQEQARKIVIDKNKIRIGFYRDMLTGGEPEFFEVNATFTLGGSNGTRIDADNNRWYDNDGNLLDGPNDWTLMLNIGEIEYYDGAITWTNDSGNVIILSLL